MSYITKKGIFLLFNYLFKTMNHELTVVDNVADNDNEDTESDDYDVFFIQILSF